MPNQAFSFFFVFDSPERCVIFEVDVRVDEVKKRKVEK